MPIPQMDPYAVLGIQRGASLLEIARARRHLAKRFHPDVARGAYASEEMRRINAAWEVLSDPELRSAWGPRGAGGQSSRRPPETWAAWSHTTDTHGAAARNAATPDRHVGWWTLIGVVLLLAFILGSGLVAALDGPDLATRDSPVMQNNLDGR